MSELDPTHTDPDKYKIVFENDQVRVLETATRRNKNQAASTPEIRATFLSNSGVG